MNYDRFVLTCLGICLLQSAPAVANAEEYMTISGSVQLAESGLAAAARVTLFDLQTLRPVTTLTDESGRFELSVTSSGTAQIVSPSTQNFPNPFNPSTTIPFNLQQAAHVSLEVFDVLGQRVRSLTDEMYGAGQHAVVWEGTDDSRRGVASGLYIYRFVVDGVPLSPHRMILLDGPADSSRGQSAPALYVEAATTYGLTIAGNGIRMFVAEGAGRQPGSGGR